MYTQKLVEIWCYRMIVFGVSLALLLTFFAYSLANAEAGLAKSQGLAAQPQTISDEGTIYLPRITGGSIIANADSENDIPSGEEGARSGEEESKSGEDKTPCRKSGKESSDGDKTDPTGDCDKDEYSEFLSGPTLDGSGNNSRDEQQGMAGTPYTRVADAVYADGLSAMYSGPSPRYISNRIFNDVAENLFSENDVTQWGFVWGQFIDHTIGLRQAGGEEAAIPFDATDPLERFQNDIGVIPFERSAAAPGTGVTSPREQINTLSSYIDAFAVYGGTDERLDWLRVGPLDGDPQNNAAELLNADGYLPTITARGDASAAPQMDLFGLQRLDPTNAVVAGDVRANENLGLTAVHTLFMREHNRIVALLPDDMPEEVKFAIARRVVGATQQYITYEEFLPAFGIKLDRYTGYKSKVDASVTNEFATVGYRAHSMIHGEFEMAAALDDYTSDELAALEAQGIELEIDGDVVEFAIPLNIAFGRPQLLQQIGLNVVLLGLASEAQYANDEMLDDQIRSVLFQIPAPGAEDPAACLDGIDLPDCFSVVNDLGVLDVVRAYDHGIPFYNQLRAAYGLPPKGSFTEITGEATESFPNDPLIDAADPINDPDILDVIAFYDADGNVLTQAEVDAGVLAVKVDRRATLAARLKAIYGSVDALDPFTGMIAEAHIEGTEFGELQLAIWKAQFTALRDGDRYFHLNDRVLKKIRNQYGIDYRQTLAEVIVNNTEYSAEDVPANVFIVVE